MLQILKGKGQKDRVVPIGARAITWVEKYLADVRPSLVTETTELHLFLSRQGTPFTPSGSRSSSATTCSRAGIGTDGACHLFRHTMATLMLEGGADIRLLQEILGHARLDSTEIYTHVSIRMLKQVHRRRIRRHRRKLALQVRDQA